MTDNLLRSQAFKLKGRLYTFTVLKLLSADQKQFTDQLDELIAKAPLFFDKTPIVLDCSALDDEPVDVQMLFECMRERHIFPIAVQGANSWVTTWAQNQGLAVLNASSAHDKSLTGVETDTPTPLSAPLVLTQSKLHAAPVRSGQQIVSKQSDLVVTAAVSHGAEVLAEGSIHVYGTLRGRALAGISGDKQARIFCLALEAELVSIAGIYLLRDTFEPVAGPCQIYLLEDHIHIERLC